MALLFEGATERGELLVVGLRPGESGAKVDVPNRPFICGVMLNDPSWPVTWLAALLRSLIARGAVYLAFWGERCEEAHDIADRVREPLTPADGDDVVMTTWHTRESLMDYLWFVAVVTCPTPGHVSDENRYLILDIGADSDSGVVSVVREVFI
jgi:hypothetical protein